MANIWGSKNYSSFDHRSCFFCNIMSKMFRRKGFVKTHLKIAVVSWEYLVLEKKTQASVRDFGFNDNSIRNQKIFWPIARNVCRQDIDMVNFTNEALLCHKKPKKDWIRSCHFVRISPIINSSSNKNGYFNSDTQKNICN